MTISPPFPIINWALEPNKAMLLPPLMVILLPDSMTNEELLSIFKVEPLCKSNELPWLIRATAVRLPSPTIIWPPDPMVMAEPQLVFAVTGEPSRAAPVPSPLPPVPFICNIPFCRTAKPFIILFRLPIRNLELKIVMPNSLPARTLLKMMFRMKVTWSAENILRHTSLV